MNGSQIGGFRALQGHNARRFANPHRNDNKET